MKLYHYLRKDGVENFGDRLNLWLWPRLIPNLLTNPTDTTFVGIGTLLNHRLPKRLSTEKAVIFGTGAGYGAPLRHWPERWKLYCVRGPLSASRLGLPDNTAIADGALLLARCFQPQFTKRDAVAVMPHIHHAVAAADRWHAICQELGWRYIDPRWSVETVLSAIDAAKLLLAEAMHGAIAADALRVPWIPVHTSARILNFKWQDWCASVGVAYQPQYLPPLMTHYPPYAKGKHPRLDAANHWRQCWQQGHFRGDLRAIASTLLGISENRTPSLSHPAMLEKRISQLEGRLEQLRRDFDLGA